MTTLAIIQARTGSTRLPGKVMADIGGSSVIALMLHRLKSASEVSRIVVAVPEGAEDDALAEHVAKLGAEVVRGPRDDVLSRFLIAAETGAESEIVRLTADCPLIDPEVVDEVIRLRRERHVQYASNTAPPTFPDGLDVEVMTREALRDNASRARSRHEREHVTVLLRTDPRYKRANLANARDLSALRWTLDVPSDLTVLRNIVSRFAPNTDFSWRDVVSLFETDPDLFAANAAETRNAGATQNTGQKLWQRARKVIPGGNMLLSKRAEMFLPERWPAYFSKAKGCTVWDLDGNAFTDVCIMGIGTNTLGYGHPDVDAAVRKVVDDGNMATFNCPEEVLLAERLVAMHPWADMARFARSGGEANAIAIRIARAAAGRETVAFCGYHGWHDWYLSANLAGEGRLAGHLLPGLAPNGVPDSLTGTALPFEYNRLDQLEALIADHDIGVIKMEVSRSGPPAPGFLEGVRALADQHGIVLVFDECTSGFRETFGGLHLKYGVEPDLAVFGKALGNGYAITGVLGRRSVMDHAQSTFISSTFWTERIGPAAALATLDVMERERSWERITATGIDVKARWEAMANAHGLPLQTFGLPALCGFTFRSENALAYKTFLTQEMLKQGYLAATLLYVCTEHTEDVLKGYFDRLDPLFARIAGFEAGDADVHAQLDGPVCHGGFQRLN